MSFDRNQSRPMDKIKDRILSHHVENVFDAQNIG